VNRREVLKTLGLGGLFLATHQTGLASISGGTRPIVLSTWYGQSKVANAGAWKILKEKGTAIDAVEQGVMTQENDWENCCVGLGGNPDRDGFVTLDASIMNHKSECGSVAFLERIKNPIQVARAVMEKSPHVMLVGKGAQQFAIESGFTLEPQKLSDHAQRAYNQWKKKSEYKPIINIEKGEKDSQGGVIHQPKVPKKMKGGEYNHDTIGMIALDVNGDLSGACTTSGMGFKMRGRVGDSPIIGAGLYVDNEVGAATATGHGEEVIRISGSFLVVEYMRQGYSPTMACRKAVERIMKKTPRNPKEIQVGFIAINKKGEHGAYAINKGFDYGLTTNVHDCKKVEPSFSIK
jgi:N4-(beta-N-acetylglucosaminyl)-L-asparaginase